LPAVVRLTDARIAWFVREATKGREGATHWAAQWGVTARHLRRLVHRYKQTGIVPTLNPNRRPKGTPLTPEQASWIDRFWGEQPVGASELWARLKRVGIWIPKHKVHAYLRDHGRTVPNPKKQKRRSRTRYEREHSGSLVHGDYHRTNDQSPHVILWLDDASRRILSGGEFPEATYEHARDTLDMALRACAEWGLIVRQINTDRGPQFYANKITGRTPGVSQFETHLAQLGLQFIPSRAHNPQTNGKLERLWFEYDKHRWRYKTLQEWIDWTNDRPHTAHHYATPNETFQAKLPPETLVGLFTRNVGGQPRLPAEEVIYGTF
jgi:transposase InsO family protein